MLGIMLFLSAKKERFMLKIPHVGTPLTDYMFATRVVGDSVQVEIIYTRINIYGVSEHRLLNLVLYTDTRWPNVNTIKKDVDAILGQALSGIDSRIRLDSERTYVHFDDNQYTGQEVL